MNIILIDNYDSFTYNLYQMLQSQTALTVKVYRNDALSWSELLALQPDRMILSPGPGHPKNESDFGICATILQDALSAEPILPTPLLGVCLGHQGLVHYAGGHVIQAPYIVHGKTSMMDIIEPSPLFEGLTNPFEAMRYHSLVVEEATLPTEFRVTARDQQHHLIMAVQHKYKPLYGVQFHPESIGTPQGEKLLANFLSSKP
jgi:anthranilate synthase component II